MTAIRRGRPAGLLGAVALLLVAGALHGQEANWRRVTGPPAVALPSDHGAHPDTRTEWWYLTANLRSGDGRRFGVQLTFFRQGLDPAAPQPGESPLRARQAVAAHLAVADVAAGRLHHAERVRRADGILAGYAEDDLRVWLEQWSLERRPDDALVGRAADRAAGLDVDLESRPLQPLVRHGDDGYSRKGPDPGNASAYVSWPRLAVAGTLVVGGRELQVTGQGWFDHEWGTSQLGEGVVGWDWFSLRLDDGSELMVYQLRRDDGTPSPFSSGTMIRPDGSIQTLGRDDVDVMPSSSWTSPATGGTYPSGWRLRVPSEDLDLVVEPLLRAAEVDGRASTGVVYWEGPVEVDGSHAGEGYVELTGYASDLSGRF